MKISFSTLGCPEWSWEDIVATAKDFGYDGIELRGIEKEIYVPQANPFTNEAVDDTKRHLSELGLDISCITSSCYFHLKDKKDEYIKEAKEYIELASKIGCPYIRVLGDAEPEPGKDIDVQAVIDALKEIAVEAHLKGVMVLLETNGVFADSNLMKKTMEAVDHESIGVLWDIHHPYRYMHEEIEQTYNNLKKYIKHIHIKDSKVENRKARYRMMGEGDIPIKECLRLLKNDGYEGFISLEWVKRWYSDLEEPGIVFMQFQNYIRTMWNAL